MKGINQCCSQSPCPQRASDGNANERPNLLWSVLFGYYGDFLGRDMKNNFFLKSSRHSAIFKENSLSYFPFFSFPMQYGKGNRLQLIKGTCFDLGHLCLLLQCRIDWRTSFWAGKQWMNFSCAAGPFKNMIFITNVHLSLLLSYPSEAEQYYMTECFLKQWQRKMVFTEGMWTWPCFVVLSLPTLPASRFWMENSRKCSPESSLQYRLIDTLSTNLSCNFKELLPLSYFVKYFGKKTPEICYRLSENSDLVYLLKQAFCWDLDFWRIWQTEIHNSLWTNHCSQTL